jgi:hypothetical protein
VWRVVLNQIEEVARGGAQQRAVNEEGGEGSIEAYDRGPTSSVFGVSRAIAVRDVATVARSAPGALLFALEVVLWPFGPKSVRGERVRAFVRRAARAAIAHGRFGSPECARRAFR